MASVVPGSAFCPRPPLRQGSGSTHRNLLASLLDGGVPKHSSKRGVLLQRGGPIFFREAVPYDYDHSIGDLELMRPFGGQMWYNALYWTNFPPLRFFKQEWWLKSQVDDAHGELAYFNSDGRLAEQWLTFGAAREDLCANVRLPKRVRTLQVEVMQYEGVLELGWDFPLQAFKPLHGGHAPFELQARRFEDNGVVSVGLSAQEFSEKSIPVEDLDACITVADYAGNPTWGYYHCLMLIGGWPYRISKIGTSSGGAGRTEMSIGIHFFDEQAIWNLLEGSPVIAPTGPEGQMEEQQNQRTGCTFWAQLYELDHPSRNRTTENAFAEAIPAEKAYVWFRVVKTVLLPSTGRKGVKIEISEDGIVPAWLDLRFLQLWVGSIPLGYLNEAQAISSEGSVVVNRVQQDGSDERGIRKVTIENEHCKLVVDDPLSLSQNELVNLGSAVRDICYLGATVRLGPRPGSWAEDVGHSRGVPNIGRRSVEAPRVIYGEAERETELDMFGAPWDQA